MIRHTDQPTTRNIDQPVRQPVIRHIDRRLWLLTYLVALLLLAFLVGPLIV